jgi:hypothetical protein
MLENSCRSRRRRRARCPQRNESRCAACAERSGGPGEHQPVDRCPRRGRAGFHGGARHHDCECFVALFAGSLSAAATDSKYFITSYLSANAVVLPIYGWLAAHLGRRRYFLLSIRSGSAFSSSLSSTGRSCSARTRNGTGLEDPFGRVQTFASLTVLCAGALFFGRVARPARL